MMKRVTNYKNSDNKSGSKISPDHIIKVYDAVMCQDLDALQKNLGDEPIVNWKFSNVRLMVKP
jgi:hypothetical protein